MPRDNTLLQFNEHQVCCHLQDNVLVISALHRLYLCHQNVARCTVPHYSITLQQMYCCAAFVLQCCITLRLRHRTAACLLRSTTLQDCTVAYIPLCCTPGGRAFGAGWSVQRASRPGVTAGSTCAGHSPSHITTRTSQCAQHHGAPIRGIPHHHFLTVIPPPTETIKLPITAQVFSRHYASTNLFFIDRFRLDCQDRQTDSIERLTDGMDNLTDGLDTLTNSMDKLTDGVNKLTDSIDKLTEASTSPPPPPPPSFARIRSFHTFLTPRGDPQRGEAALPPADMGGSCRRKGILNRSHLCIPASRVYSTLLSLITSRAEPILMFCRALCEHWFPHM